MSRETIVRLNQSPVDLRLTYGSYGIHRLVLGNVVTNQNISAMAVIGKRTAAWASDMRRI
jgi:hypothetical protein